ncbi:MAG: T9SS type A sorting domain-containing protein [Candidatus Kapaibacterium sp.]
MDIRIPFAKKIKTKFSKTSPDFWIYVQLGPDTTGDNVSLLMDATTDDPANHNTMGNTVALPDGDRGYVWGVTPTESFQGPLGGRFQDQNANVLFNQLVMVAYTSGLSLAVDDTKLEGNALAQNYPNPFNPSTEIKYSIATASDVSLKVYNTLGVEVRTVVNDREEAGGHQVSFYGDNLPSGTYFYTLKAGTFSQTKRMVLSK